MKQSTITFGVILFAFIVYITVRGQLPSYLALFKGKKHATITVTGGSSKGGSSDSGSGPSPEEIAQIAQVAAAFA